MLRLREHGVKTEAQVVSVRVSKNSSSERQSESTTFRFRDQYGVNHETTFFNYEGYGPMDVVYDPDNPSNVTLESRVNGWMWPTWRPWGVFLLGAGCALFGGLFGRRWWLEEKWNPR